MAEYIDKHEAYLLLKDLEAAYIYPPVKEAYATAARRIDEIKATDVQPVKRGKWEEEDTMPYDNFVVCSECGLNLSPQNYTKEEWQESFKYCPCCGARMDGGAKND